MVNREQQIESRAPSHSVAAYLDTVGLELGEGPYLGSIRKVKLVRAADMA